MKIREVEQYAIDNDLFDSGKFEVTSLSGKTMQFKWLDAYMGLFIQLGKENKGFFRTDQWIKEVGDDFDFRIID